MMYLNEVAAMFGILMLLNAGRGFWPPMLKRVLAKKWNGHTLLFVGFIILDAKGIFRMAYWDIYRPFFETGINGSFSGTIVNTLINAASGIAGLVACGALYYTIPLKDRAGWNWISAPWYPTGMRIWNWRK